MAFYPFVRCQHIDGEHCLMCREDGFCKILKDTGSCAFFKDMRLMSKDEIAYYKSEAWKEGYLEADKSTIERHVKKGEAILREYEKAGRISK